MHSFVIERSQHRVVAIVRILGQLSDLPAGEVAVSDRHGAHEVHHALTYIHTYSTTEGKSECVGAGGLLCTVGGSICRY